MGLFDFMKGKKENVIAAPVKGECIPISEVADPTFAEEILGKGMAIKPTEGKFYAPADGTISTLFPTGHAIGLTTSEGAVPTKTDRWTCLLPVSGLRFIMTSHIRQPKKPRWSVGSVP